MIELSWDVIFREKFREWIQEHPDLVQVIRNKLEAFSRSPFDPELGTRLIAGPGIYGFPINGGYYLAFIFIDPAKEKPVLIDIVDAEDIERGEIATAGQGDY